MPEYDQCEEPSTKYVIQFLTDLSVEMKEEIHKLNERLDTIEKQLVEHIING